MKQRSSLTLEEQYLFFKCASDDMREARAFLRCIPRLEVRAARCGLFTATVVTYMRPFVKSQIDSSRRYWLEPSEVGFDSGQTERHERYKTYRSRTFAHTDLEALRASVRVTKPAPGRSRVHIGSVHVGRDPSRSNRIELHGNINAVMKYLEEKLSELHERFAA